MSLVRSVDIPASYESNGLTSMPDYYNSTYFFDLDSCLQDSFELEYLEIESPRMVDYDESKLKLKLQELERALLDDDDREWNAPVHESPNGSCSSESNLSAEISLRTPKQLLFDCAGAISEGNTKEALILIEELRRTVSVQGDPRQRIAAYMVEGLAARVLSSGKSLYRALKCKVPLSSDQLAAMQILFEVCPCYKFGLMAANGAILKAMRGESRVHVVDFDVNQGSQYVALIQKLGESAKFTDNLPYIRLTGVDDPESVHRLVAVGKRLEKLAEALKVPFEFRAVASEASRVAPEMLGCRAGEAVVVNFAFQLHHMPDESVSMANERDGLLRMVKGLRPKVVTVVEQDMNANTAPFFPRFVEAYGYYSAVFESLDVTLPRESQDRVNVEMHCLAREIVNIVACEGEERIERYEVAGKWRARMMMAGFVPAGVSNHVNFSIREVIKKEYCGMYTMREEIGALHFGWEDKTLVVASTWR